MNDSSSFRFPPTECSIHRPLKKGGNSASAIVKEVVGEQCVAGNFRRFNLYDKRIHSESLKNT
jgi:hypothetical protein